MSAKKASGKAAKTAGKTKNKTKKAAPQAAKPKVLMISFGGCSGCHITFLDLHEELLGVLDAVEVVRASVIADMNRKEIPECDIALIEGAICNEENLELLKQIREKAKTLITLGTCSTYGGVPGLRNYFSAEEALKEAYEENDTTPDGKIPRSPELPKILPYVKQVSGVVDVDYFIPGCPPVPDTIKKVLVSLLEGKEPQLSRKNLCEDCNREHEQIIPGDRQFIAWNIDSVMESDLDPHRCFLEQGVLCMGPATMTGCGGRCTHANMPCRGCFGPNPNAIEQGCEMSNAMAPIMPIGALIKKEDLPGTFYRYALPSSIIPRLIKDHNDIVMKQKGIKKEEAENPEKKSESVSSEDNGGAQ